MTTLRREGSILATSSEEWTADVAGIEREAARLVVEAREAAGAIEARLKFLADTHSGSMVGLEYKVKPEQSLIRKMKAMWTGPQLTLEDIVEAQYDVLRFTMLLPTLNHAASVKEVLSDLEKEGHAAVEIKNYWNALTYRGINSILVARSRLNFELQFHTSQSFDQKQNRTHLLYEALRVERNALKQNLYYMDMVAMWDMVETPADIMSIGTEKSQPAPTLKNVTKDEAEAINRIVHVKKTVRRSLQPLFDSLRKIEPRIDPLMKYCCACFNASLKGVDSQIRGTLGAQRKIEEDLRRTFRHNDAANLQHVIFPPDLEAHVERFALAQPDLLLYTVVFDNEAEYSAGTLGIIDTLVNAGFSLLYVDNNWHDHEKHHPISAAFEIHPQHAVRRNKTYPLKFSVEFHTAATYQGAVMRNVAKTLIEESLYKRGDTYKKAYVDVTLRYDPALCDLWMQVSTPPGAPKIGRPHTVEPEGRKAECLSHTKRWWSRAERHQHTREAGIAVVSIVIGVVATVALKRFR